LLNFDRNVTHGLMANKIKTKNPLILPQIATNETESQCNTQEDLEGEYGH